MSGFFTGGNLGHIYRGSLPSNGGEATRTDISGTGTDGRLIAALFAGVGQSFISKMN